MRIIWEKNDIEGGLQVRPGGSSEPWLVCCEEREWTLVKIKDGKMYGTFQHKLVNGKRSVGSVTRWVVSSWESAEELARFFTEGGWVPHGFDHETCPF